MLTGVATPAKVQRDGAVNCLRADLVGGELATAAAAMVYFGS